MKIGIKRAYEEVSDNDGYRVLVDRLWPRGVSKEKLALDEWCKDIAPSTELRKWFDHIAERFTEFREKYRDELRASSVPAELLKRAQSHTQLTLVYGAKDPEINHAVVLREYLKSA